MSNNEQLNFFGEKQDFIKSPLNYTGGKYKLLPNLFELVPKNIKTFYDIFGGGFNVGINVDSERIVYNDINCYLGELFVYFRNEGFHKVNQDIKSVIKKYNLNQENVEGYNELRKDYNSNPSALNLFILICFAFNHQIRFNSRHEFNSPFGKNRSSYNESIENNLNKFCFNLQNKNVEFNSKDFTEFIKVEYNTDDFVYCDPPYLITTGSYNDGKRGFKDWSIEEEKQLLGYLDSLNNQGIKFMLSNVFYHKGLSNGILIEWSKKYKVHYVNKNYKNSSYNGKNKDKKTVEVIITNY